MVSTRNAQCTVETDFIGKNTRSKARAMAEVEISQTVDNTSSKEEFSSQNSKRSARIQTIVDYSLSHKRKREIESEIPKKSRKSTKLQLQQQIDNELPNRQYLVDEIILATIPGYAPWPARILKMIGQTISVQFFGTGQM